ncbi:hypothetical protein PSP20601_05390 [Pandoraea sputorum]|nr:hypothetical protein PSP20601_05390 [Pandoraea sputorum]
MAAGVQSLGAHELLNRGESVAVNGLRRRRPNGARSLA